MSDFQTTRQNGPRRRAAVIAAATTLAAVGGLAFAAINLDSGPAGAAQPSRTASAAVHPDVLKNDPEVWKVEPGPFDADGQQAYTVVAKNGNVTGPNCGLRADDRFIHFDVTEPGHNAYTVKGVPQWQKGTDYCITQIKVASTVPGTTVVKAWLLEVGRDNLRGQADLEFEPTIG
jgi:hypothetical protein